MPALFVPAVGVIHALVFFGSRRTASGKNTAVPTAPTSARTPLVIIPFTESTVSEHRPSGILCEQPPLRAASTPKPTAPPTKRAALTEPTTRKAVRLDDSTGTGRGDGSDEVRTLGSGERLGRYRVEQVRRFRLEAARAVLCLFTPLVRRRVEDHHRDSIARLTLRIDDDTGRDDQVRAVALSDCGETWRCRSKPRPTSARQSSARAPPPSTRADRTPAASSPARPPCHRRSPSRAPKHAPRHRRERCQNRRIEAGLGTVLG